MSDRTIEEARDAFKSCRNPQYYDQWAPTCDKDHDLMDYRAPRLAVDVLMTHLTQSPAQTRVLDVACGSGLVAKLMSSLGFRLFSGVDCSEGMLEQARRGALYQDVRQALLGTEELPVDPEEFDVVMIVGALYPGFVPVSVVREMCHAAKPGGLVCMARGNYQRPAHFTYTEELQKELRAMEDEGLWSRVEVAHKDRYLLDPHSDGQYISGTVYLYKKCT